VHVTEYRAQGPPDAKLAGQRLLRLAVRQFTPAPQRVGLRDQPQVLASGSRQAKRVSLAVLPAHQLDHDHVHLIIVTIRRWCRQGQAARPLSD
jgi:hypothetical protein